MFGNHLCGDSTGHRRGFEYKSNGPSGYYVFLHFHTPFFFTVDGVRGEGKAGQCILHRPESNITHGHISESEGFVNDWIQFTAEEEDILPLGITFDTPITVPEGKTFGAEIEEIMNETAFGDQVSKHLMSCGMYRIFTAIKRFECSESALELDNVRSRLLSTRMQVLNRYGEQWSLKKMAELSGYSVSRFCALYNQQFGESPMEELLSERLIAARRLLALRAYKIGEVAELCGFSSIHYFSSFFKARTGYAPSEYPGDAREL